VHPFMSSECAVFLDDADRDEEREALARWCHEFDGLEVVTLSSEKGCVRLVLSRLQPMVLPARGGRLAGP
jgi:hypothetical protein